MHLSTRKSNRLVRTFLCPPSLFWHVTTDFLLTVRRIIDVWPIFFVLDQPFCASYSNESSKGLHLRLHLYAFAGIFVFILFYNDSSKLETLRNNFGMCKCSLSTSHDTRLFHLAQCQQGTLHRTYLKGYVWMTIIKLQVVKSVLVMSFFKGMIGKNIYHGEKCACS